MYKLKYIKQPIGELLNGHFCLGTRRYKTVANLMVHVPKHEAAGWYTHRCGRGPGTRGGEVRTEEAAARSRRRGAERAGSEGPRPRTSRSSPPRNRRYKLGLEAWKRAMGEAYRGDPRCSR